MIRFLFFAFLIGMVGCRPSTSPQKSTLAGTRSSNPDTSGLYFPERQSSDTSRSPGLDSFVNDWYSKVLSQMHEPILKNATIDGSIYRFTWLRTFHHPIVIRIVNVQDNITLISKIMSGQSGFDPGRLNSDTAISVATVQWDTFQKLLHAANFEHIPSLQNPDEMGKDGAEWIVEGYSKGHYGFVERWSPRSGSFREACWYLVSLANLKLEEWEVY